MSYQKLDESSYRDVWDMFYSRFAFKPDYHARNRPAIIEPPPFVTYRFRDAYGDEDVDDLNRRFVHAFKEITDPGECMYALDWQHESYIFCPHEDWSDLPISIFPDGDYFIFLNKDFTQGTFGHPWQRSLCVFGERLLQVIREGTPNIIEAVIRADPSYFGPLIFPSDPEAARDLIEDPESGLENF